jgi:hypothetical protein
MGFRSLKIFMKEKYQKDLEKPMRVISEIEFLDHIEDDDFFEKYGSPVRIHTNDDRDLVALRASDYDLRFAHLDDRNM